MTRFVTKKIAEKQMKFLEQNIGEKVKVYSAGCGVVGTYEEILKKIFPFVALELEGLIIPFIGTLEAIQKIIRCKDKKLIYQNPLIDKSYGLARNCNAEREKIRKETFGRVVYLEQELEEKTEELKEGLKDAKEDEKSIEQIPNLITEGKKWTTKPVKFENLVYKRLDPKKNKEPGEIHDEFRLLKMAVGICRALSLSNKRESFREIVDKGLEGIKGEILRRDVDWVIRYYVNRFHPQGGQLLKWREKNKL